MTAATPSGNPIATAAVDRLFNAQRDDYLSEASRLVQACRSLIAETGRVDPTVAAILDRAGLSSRAFYRIFNSKEELLVALLQDGTTSMIGYLATEMATARDPLERIRIWIRVVMAPYTDPSRANTGSLLVHSLHWATLFPNELTTMRKELLSSLVQAIVDLRGPGSRQFAERISLNIYDMYAGIAGRSEAHATAIASAEVDLLADVATHLAVTFPFGPAAAALCQDGPAVWL